MLDETEPPTGHPAVEHEANVQGQEPDRLAVIGAEPAADGGLHVPLLSPNVVSTGL